MTEKLDRGNQSLPQRMVQKIGELVGVRPPEWFDQSVWEASSPGQRRMIKTMHDRGGEGFRILRSAEAPMREFKREQ